MAQQGANAGKADWFLPDWPTYGVRTIAFSSAAEES